MRSELPGTPGVHQPVPRAVRGGLLGIPRCASGAERLRGGTWVLARMRDFQYSHLALEPGVRHDSIRFAALPGFANRNESNGQREH